MSASAASPSLTAPAGQSAPASCLVQAAPLWAVHQELYRSRRVLLPLIRQNDAELGRCLTEAQAALAVPGPHGGFKEWLRTQRIARATVE